MVVLWGNMKLTPVTLTERHNLIVQSHLRHLCALLFLFLGEKGRNTTLPVSVGTVVFILWSAHPKGQMGAKEQPELHTTVLHLKNSFVHPLVNYFGLFGVTFVTISRCYWRESLKAEQDKSGWGMPECMLQSCDVVLG